MTLSESSKVKVTDKRMFTSEGELREEYSFLEDAATRRAEEADRVETESRGEAAVPEASEVPEEPPAESAQPPPADLPELPETGSEPTFVDLLSLLAEPAAVYLGDARLPDGRSAQDLDMARLHIDLLDVLRQKTAGNLDPREAAVLEDLLYRLRTRYLQKKRG